MEALNEKEKEIKDTLDDNISPAFKLNSFVENANELIGRSKTEKCEATEKCL